MNNTSCTSYLCHNKATVEKLCAQCHASERLVLAVNAALEDFLNATFPVREAAHAHLRNPDVIPEIFDNQSPVRQTISDATTSFGAGVVQLISLAQGCNVYVTSGAWLDDWMTPPRWYGGLGWDISEDQTDYSAAGTNS